MPSKVFYASEFSERLVPLALPLEWGIVKNSVVVLSSGLSYGQWLSHKLRTARSSADIDFNLRVWYIFSKADCHHCTWKDPFEDNSQVYHCLAICTCINLSNHLIHEDTQFFFKHFYHMFDLEVMECMWVGLSLPNPASVSFLERECSCRTIFKHLTKMSRFVDKLVLGHENFMCHFSIADGEEGITQPVLKARFMSFRVITFSIRCNTWLDSPLKQGRHRPITLFNCLLIFIYRFQIANDRTLRTF